MSDAVVLGLQSSKSTVKLPVPTQTLTRWNAAMCLFHGAFTTITLIVGNTDLRVL